MMILLLAATGEEGREVLKLDSLGRGGRRSSRAAATTRLAAALRGFRLVGS